MLIYVALASMTFVHKVFLQGNPHPYSYLTAPGLVISSQPLMSGCPTPPPLSSTFHC